MSSCYSATALGGAFTGISITTPASNRADQTQGTLTATLETTEAGPDALTSSVATQAFADLTDDSFDFTVAGNEATHTYKVWDASSGGSEIPNVTASVTSTTLTLVGSAVADIGAGEYFIETISAAPASIPSGTRLQLTLTRQATINTTANNAAVAIDRGTAVTFSDAWTVAAPLTIPVGVSVTATAGTFALATYDVTNNGTLNVAAVTHSSVTGKITGTGTLTSAAAVDVQSITNSVEITGNAGGLTIGTNVAVIAAAGVFKPAANVMYAMVMDASASGVIGDVLSYNITASQAANAALSGTTGLVIPTVTVGANVTLVLGANQDVTIAAGETLTVAASGIITMDAAASIALTAGASDAAKTKFIIAGTTPASMGATALAEVIMPASNFEVDINILVMAFEKQANTDGELYNKPVASKTYAKTATGVIWKAST